MSESTSQTQWPPINENDDEDSDEEIVYQPKSASARIAPTTSIPFSSRASGINATALAILSAGSLALSAIPIAVALAYVSGGLVMDPTMEEEAKASARFGFGWAITHSAQEDDEMDQDDDGLDMELVWADSEGSFSRSEVSPCMRP
jgi:exosome complex component RRP46